MSDPALDVVEFLLTAHLYTENRDLDGDDLPPRFRETFFTDGEIERPLTVTEETARTATSVQRPWEAVSDLLFTQRAEFSGELSLTQPEMALDWFLERADEERLLTNPTVARAAEG
ncbi:ATP-binding protein, partial [Halobium palmae]